MWNVEEALGAKTKQTTRLQHSAHHQAVHKSDAAGTEDTGYKCQLSDERNAKVEREVREWARGGRGEVPRDTLALVDQAGE